MIPIPPRWKRIASDVFAQAALLTLALGLVAGSGCCAPNKALVAGVDATWSVIHPEYEAYLVADATLDPEARGVKLKTAAALTRLVDEAKKSNEPPPDPPPTPEIPQ
jgi:hypothetical protein